MGFMANTARSSLAALLALGASAQSFAMGDTGVEKMVSYVNARDIPEAAAGNDLLIKQEADARFVAAATDDMSDEQQEALKDQIRGQVQREAQTKNYENFVDAGALQGLMNLDQIEQMEMQGQQAFDQVIDEAELEREAERLGKGTSIFSMLNPLREDRLRKGALRFSKIKTASDLAGDMTSMILGVNEKGEPVSFWDALNAAETNINQFITKLFETGQIAQRMQEKGMSAAKLNKAFKDIAKQDLEKFNREIAAEKAHLGALPPEQQNLDRLTALINGRNTINRVISDKNFKPSRKLKSAQALKAQSGLLGKFMALIMSDDKAAKYAASHRMRGHGHVR